jgi:hypothetical protein
VGAAGGGDLIELHRGELGLALAIVTAAELEEDVGGDRAAGARGGRFRRAS